MKKNHDESVSRNKSRVIISQLAIKEQRKYKIT